MPSLHPVPRLALMCLALWAAPAWSQSTVTLVTPEEMRTFQGDTGYDVPLPRTRSLALPAIEILRPEGLTQKLRAPFPITLKFLAGDAAIVPGSFKIFYGALRLDITQRVAKFVQPSPEGFALESAAIPSGRHRLILQVSDEKNRLAERELRFEVE